MGALLFYGRNIDLTILVALITITSQHNQLTKKTEQAINQLLDYLTSHPNATIRYYTSEMILKIYSDASYLSEKNAHSWSGGYFFLGNRVSKGKQILLNGSVHTLCKILKHVVSSAAEAELAALFLNAQEGKILRLTLDKMGHPQPPTPMHCDNTTAYGIVHVIVKRQRSRAMDKQYFWIVDKKPRRTSISRGHQELIT